MTSETRDKTLKDIKPGDLVFVVWQQTRRDTGPPLTQWLPVKTVGRKYGYILRHARDAPFSLDTGESHHKESNDRANGFGFDVYLTEESYHEQIRATARYNELKERICPRGWFVTDLSPATVEAIHEILDLHERREET